MGPKPASGRGGENPFFQILAAAGIPWLVTTILQSLPPESHLVLLCMCAKTLSAFLILFFILLFNWFTMVFNWATKLLYNVVSVYVI